ncbi:LysR family transcriptional regulator [Henriciella mobilis]|uniref:LysR family transcriptional regulator n=1 Tax=Henriciella mobilis TaxID=2305467 RepID=UPI000E666C3F|nr:LysR family transcriptional regulator [Henriciella mobilis]RIJ17807.1 LysR family transcriptional regulator [Henriciella mobilis]RIJ25380.1 LysR family transcriptional regulator [Henriciella mobilis]
MVDRLDSMSILVTAVDAGSFTAGARELGMPLATVSRRVAELEERLGAQLVTRSTRGLALTEAGVTYVAACRRILEQVAEAERAAAGEFSAPRGLLTVTAPIVFGRIHMVPLITAFLMAYPDVDVRLHQGDRMVSFQEEHVDLAVRIGHLPDSSLRARRVGAVREVVCASPAYLAAQGEPARAEDLAHHDCITFENLMGADRWRFGDRQVRIGSRLIVNTADAAICAAAAGLGLTRVLSYQVAEAVADGRLKIVLTGDEPEAWPVHLLYGGGILPQKLRAFIDFAAPRLSAALSGNTG